MSYCIRLLSPTEDAPAAGEIAAALQSEGFDVSLEAAPSQEEWETLAVLPAGQEAIRVHRSLRRGEESPVDVEVDTFLDVLLEREEGAEVTQVERGLRAARQMLLVEVPEAFPWGAQRTVVDALVQFLAERTEALIQADGEGFYDREGNLLMPLE